MEIKSNRLKQKTLILIISVVFVCGLFSFSAMTSFFLMSHEKFVKKSMYNLLEGVADNSLQEGQFAGDINEKIEWTFQNTNLHVYRFYSIEELNRNIPFDLNGEDLISGVEFHKLEDGEAVFQKVLSHDPNIALLTLVYPVMADGMLESVLFHFMPVNIYLVDQVLPLLILSLGIIISLIVFIFVRKFFYKYKSQLDDLKMAAIQVSEGNYDTKVRSNSLDELGEISNAFNMMSEALKNDHERMKDFIADVSHEIKTPLTYIKSYNHALLDGMIQTEEEQTKIFMLIDREAGRLQRLIQNFLDFAKLDAQSLELNKQPIVFAQLIEEVMAKYDPIFKEKNMQLKMELDYDVIINGDEDRIEQIIQNIVQNAIIYSKREGRIEFKLSMNDSNCLLSISDNGRGISKENLSIITNRFVRVDKVSSLRDSGTGIGLSIVEKLMTLHDGEMFIESELGVGTKVNLLFPVIECDYMEMVEE